MNVLGDGLQGASSCVPGGLLSILFYFFFLLIVRHNLIDDRVSHWRFIRAQFDIIQVGCVLAVNLSSCFREDSILSGPFKTQDAHVNNDMLYFRADCLSVTTR